MEFVETIRFAISTALEPLGVDRMVSEYFVGNLTPPWFEIDYDREGVNYDQSMGRGTDEWWWLVRGVTSGGVDISSQQEVDEWLAPAGDKSVKQMIEADFNGAGKYKLGGAVEFVHVVSARVRRYQPAGGNILLGAEWRLRILANGN